MSVKDESSDDYELSIVTDNELYENGPDTSFVKYVNTSFHDSVISTSDNKGLIDKVFKSTNNSQNGIGHFLKSQCDNEDSNSIDMSDDELIKLYNEKAKLMKEVENAFKEEQSEMSPSRKNDISRVLHTTVCKVNLQSIDHMSSEDYEQCPICLIQFIDQDIASPNNCHHSYCLECLIEWSKNVTTCPIDRIPFEFIYARHSYKGTIFKKIEVVKKVDQDKEEMDESLSMTLCQICNLGDREESLLLCDICDNGYHMDCLTPPLAQVPIEEWYCPECDSNQLDHNHSDHELCYDRKIQREKDYTVLSLRENFNCSNQSENSSYEDDGALNLCHPKIHGGFVPIIPRTRASERVRARIIKNRRRTISERDCKEQDAPGPSSVSRLASSRLFASPPALGMDELLEALRRRRRAAALKHKSGARAKIRLKKRRGRGRRIRKKGRHKRHAKRKVKAGYKRRIRPTALVLSSRGERGGKCDLSPMKGKNLGDAQGNSYHGHMASSESKWSERQRNKEAFSLKGASLSPLFSPSPSISPPSLRDTPPGYIAKRSQTFKEEQFTKPTRDTEKETLKKEVIREVPTKENDPHQDLLGSIFKAQTKLLNITGDGRHVKISTDGSLHWAEVKVPRSATNSSSPRPASTIHRPPFKQTLASNLLGHKLKETEGLSYGSRHNERSSTREAQPGALPEPQPRSGSTKKNVENVRIHRERHSQSRLTTETAPTIRPIEEVDRHRRDTKNAHIPTQDQICNDPRYIRSAASRALEEEELLTPFVSHRDGSDLSVCYNSIFPLHIKLETIFPDPVYTERSQILKPPELEKLKILVFEERQNPLDVDGGRLDILVKGAKDIPTTRVGKNNGEDGRRKDKHETLEAPRSDLKQRAGNHVREGELQLRGRDSKQSQAAARKPRHGRETGRRSNDRNTRSRHHSSSYSQSREPQHSSHRTRRESSQKSPHPRPDNIPKSHGHQSPWPAKAQSRSTKKPDKFESPQNTKVASKPVNATPKNRVSPCSEGEDDLEILQVFRSGPTNPSASNPDVEIITLDGEDCGGEPPAPSPKHRVISPSSTTVCNIPLPYDPFDPTPVSPPSSTNFRDGDESRFLIPLLPPPIPCFMMPPPPAFLIAATRQLKKLNRSADSSENSERPTSLAFSETLLSNHASLPPPPYLIESQDEKLSAASTRDPQDIEATIPMPTLSMPSRLPPPCNPFNHLPNPFPSFNNAIVLAPLPRPSVGNGGTRGKVPVLKTVLSLKMNNRHPGPRALASVFDTSDDECDLKLFKNFDREPQMEQPLQMVPVIAKSSGPMPIDLPDSRDPISTNLGTTRDAEGAASKATSDIDKVIDLLSSATKLKREIDPKDAPLPKSSKSADLNSTIEEISRILLKAPLGSTSNEAKGRNRRDSKGKHDTKREHHRGKDHKSSGSKEAPRTKRAEGSGRKESRGDKESNGGPKRTTNHKAQHSDHKRGAKKGYGHKGDDHTKSSSTRNDRESGKERSKRPSKSPDDRGAKRAKPGRHSPRLPKHHHGNGDKKHHKNSAKDANQPSSSTLLSLLDSSVAQTLLTGPAGKSSLSLFPPCVPTDPLKRTFLTQAPKGSLGEEEEQPPSLPPPGSLNNGFSQNYHRPRPKGSPGSDSAGTEDGSYKAASPNSPRTRIGPPRSLNAYHGTDFTQPRNVHGDNYDENEAPEFGLSIEEGTVDGKVSSASAEPDDNFGEPMASDEIPNSAMDMIRREKYFQKLNHQQRVAEEVKVSLKPFFTRGEITKQQYKDIMRRAVNKICGSKSGKIKPLKILSLVQAYVKLFTRS